MHLNREAYFGQYIYYSMMVYMHIYIRNKLREIEIHKGIFLDLRYTKSLAASPMKL